MEDRRRSFLDTRKPVAGQQRFLRLFARRATRRLL